MEPDAQPITSPYDGQRKQQEDVTEVEGNTVDRHVWRVDIQANEKAGCLAPTDLLSLLYLYYFILFFWEGGIGGEK